MDQILSNIGLLIEFPVVNLKIVIDGVLIGALFALAAYGLALVWGVMNVKNLAQGDFVIGGGYVSWWLNRSLGLQETFGFWGPLLGVIVAFLLMALLASGIYGTSIHRWVKQRIKTFGRLAALVFVFFVIGIYLSDSGQSESVASFGTWLSGLSAIALTLMLVAGGGIYDLVISRVIERDLFTSLLATFGLAIMMAQIMNLLFGSDTQSLDLGLDTIYFADGFIDVPMAKLIGVLMAAVLAACVVLFMKNSRMGQAIRATAQDARAARVLGIDTEKVYAFTFALNAAICGAAGAIIVMVWVIQPFYGITYSVRAFVIVTAAGLGNLPGVIVAGLGIGAAEQYGSHIFGIGYQQAIAVLLLLLVLVYRLMQQKRNRQVLQ